MCVVSMVHDFYDKTWPPYQVDAQTVQSWEKWIERFYQAKQAAETVDALTNQPDCVDPTKATLTGRVAKLEQEIAELKKQIG
jgi:hypothetical protein